MLRAGSVKRFHIVNTTRVQTLAEHQYNVAIFAAEICRLMGFDDQTIASVTQLALLHDIGEVRTGDIPTPTKKVLRGAFGSDFDGVLAQFDAVDVSDLPAHIKAILKCADYLDSMFFLGEHKVGRHADAVMADILNDADDFFRKAGTPGTYARRIWGDLEHAVYRI